MSDFSQIKFSEIQKGMLYLVATPIGNLADITLRALDTLKNVDLIFCEDTRISARLLAHYGIRGSLHMYHDHSGTKERQTIIKSLQEGKSVALVSDAGTPLISDPGYKLVVACHEEAIPVTLIPGPCALIHGLVISGLPTNEFYFAGFLPTKTKDRQAKLERLFPMPATLIFYETGPKLSKTLSDFKRFFQGRPMVIARELTKKFEAIHQGSVDELHTHYTKEDYPKGELVLILEGHQEVPSELPSHPALYRKLLEKMSTKEAAEFLSELLKQPKNVVYHELLKIRNAE